MRLEDITAGTSVNGVVPNSPVTVVAVAWHGADALNLVYRPPTGPIQEAVLYRSDEDRLSLAVGSRRPFDAPADDFKLAAEAQRIQRAGLFDPMIAVATSEVEPLPHQIRAVYGEMLPRRPLRFLLADDPGAGKTIMAGLLIKELMLRDDVHRCLVVAPGGLVHQWQDELFLKFGLRFGVLAAGDGDTAPGRSVFDDKPYLIARMDQLARNELLLEQLDDSEWDLVIVDEAHRMSARWFNSKLNRTRRFDLGERLGNITRHLLLMTATPHNGVEADFQTFLSLLDRDEFAGKAASEGPHRKVDTSRFMRRMVKEDLLTFDGTPLFPERRAETVPYELSPLEQDLYDSVTAYVREGMGRADNLDSGRKRTVGFALTVLQRRLASSPAAIHESLRRRTARLRTRADDLANGVGVLTATPASYLPDDDDDWASEEAEVWEEELVDAATAARTEAELRAEIAELDQLVQQAALVRSSGRDVKWSELRSILEGNVLERDGGTPRKLIVFTEHRDTLDYLVQRIGTILGRRDAVVAMHGGVNRVERRRIAEEFTKNPECQVLVATDAAGEGLNLQAAHLMVNYDLPWNPNRIEQRFGRIHRIGQTEVCRLWNLVAITTREGEVFKRLLDKIDEQREAYGGKIFDVLGGDAFGDQALRDLLMEAIRYGDQPEVRARMQEVIDAGVSEGLNELMNEALAREILSPEELAHLRRRMDEARARRLQPHYIEMAFRAGFERLGGRMARREKNRYEISRVPAELRTRRAAIASRYLRVTFDIASIDHPSSERADLLAPGHPLHDAVIAATLDRAGEALEHGTVLVSPDLDEPQLLVGVTEEVLDGTGEVVGRTFGYAYADEHGTVTAAGPAPYLDCVAAPEGPLTERARGMSWLDGAESAAVSWLVEHELPGYVAQLAPRRREELDAAARAVETRLRAEITRLGSEALAASAKESAGQAVKESSTSLSRKADDLQARLVERLASIERQRTMRTPPPRVACAAVVVPASWLDGADGATESPADRPPVDTTVSERRGVDAALAAERALGREPTEMAHNNKGYDIASVAPDRSTVFIEVKARVEGADDFVVTHSEVMVGKNTTNAHRLVLVKVDPRGPQHDEIRYLVDHFRTVDLGSLFTEKVVLSWDKTWASGGRPV
ncbi:helicase-related protein [Ornithinimicrobium tianjinense]|uniref:RNA helicase n=1 Tax=Ornithinimicrobium tianjinense TaxID=1195761 RepID=A0A917BED8_9MICO|nr:helicase-related protein [Ornithinimicrobium tianjinense]GGF40072.1 RNA helicase [Ornithinimicrobium tianjinense]